MSQVIKHALVRTTTINDGAGWAYMVTTEAELNTLNDGIYRQRAVPMLYGEGAWGGFGHAPYRAGGLAEFGIFERKKYAKQLEYIRKGTPVLIWHNNGCYYPYRECGSMEILEIHHLEYPKMPTEKLADIVVCENDPMAEDWWIEVLKNKYPDKSICVLTRFRERSMQDIETAFKAAGIVSFTTTFSSYDWFEMALDALIKVDKYNQVMFGNNGNGDWISKLPSQLREKLENIQASTKMKVEQYLTEPSI